MTCATTPAAKSTSATARKKRKSKENRNRSAAAILVFLLLADPLQAIAPKAINPLVTETTLMLGETLNLPDGYQVEAMTAGTVTLIVAEGNNTVRTADWTFRPGDRWPIDGNTSLKGRSTPQTFRFANCRTEAGTVQGIRQAQAIAMFAADVCR